jgi:hypothetical protein
VAFFEVIVKRRLQIIQGGQRGFDQGPGGFPVQGVPVAVGPIVDGGVVTGGPYYAPPGYSPPGSGYVGTPFQINPPVPVTGQPVPVGAPTTGGAAQPAPPASSQGGLGIDLSSISGLLSGSVFGIPVSWIGIGLILYFFVFKKGRR